MLTLSHARHTAVTIITKVLGAVAVLVIVPNAAIAGSADVPDTGSPEVKLIDAYNFWFIVQGNYKGAIKTIRAGLPRYITDRTVLHEAESLPWGGTMVGYNGWERLCRISGPIWGKIQSSLTMSGGHHYQHGNIVINEITVSIAGTNAAPAPFRMQIMEKYSVENGRIARIDEFYSDTAGLLKRLQLLGAIPSA